MQSSDRELSCTSCGRPFVFTAAEQTFFAERGFQEPRRCKPCRNARKAEGGGAGGRERQSGPMQNARGGGGGQQQRGGRGANGPGRNGQRDPQAAQNARYGEQLPAPSDPNGYRAPGFSMASTDPHAIDYAGLPRDEEEDANNAAAPSNPFSRDQNVDRFGLRTSAPSSFGGNTRFGGGRGGQGGNNRGRFDRGGSQRDGYRSPAFADSAPADPRGQGGSRGGGGGGAKQARPRRALIDTTCATCGAAAKVPFEPSAERPAYCKPCFDAKRAARTESPAT